ncbi:MAG: hypothetical protein F6J93_33285 [Oscillatoria sp. SIO1A7]|nr:hypothetical protein [Oscillatoria sp. SIO1A7]
MLYILETRFFQKTGFLRSNKSRYLQAPFLSLLRGGKSIALERWYSRGALLFSYTPHPTPHTLHPKPYTLYPH